MNISRLLITIPAFLLSAAIGSGCAHADDCTFKYWEIIPASARCEIFILPDFTFREIPQKAEAPDHIKRFCKLYQVKSANSLAEPGYCYTGEGDRTGPGFTVGGKTYLADLNFTGCLDGEKREGIVFIQGSWENAPSNMQRLWPVDSRPKRVGCSPK